MLSVECKYKNCKISKFSVKKKNGLIYKNVRMLKNPRGGLGGPPVDVNSVLLQYSLPDDTVCSHLLPNSFRLCSN
jgi:hypothetical protein